MKAQITILLLLGLYAILMLFGPGLFWIWAFGGVGADYVPRQRLIDAKTGLVVEVGELENFSSLCTVLNVFKDQRAEHTAHEANNDLTIFHACGVGDHGQTRISFENGCYVLTMSDHSTARFRPVWSDGQYAHEICFRLDRATTK